MMKKDNSWNDKSENWRALENGVMPAERAALGQ